MSKNSDEKQGKIISPEIFTSEKKYGKIKNSKLFLEKTSFGYLAEQRVAPPVFFRCEIHGIIDT